MKELMPKMYLSQSSNMRVSSIFHLIDHMSKSWKNLRPLEDYRSILQVLIDKYGLSRNYLAKDAVKKHIKRGFIIQHDIDINIISALQMARIEHDMGVKSTFYVLHNAFYYMFWSRDCPHRHDSMITIYRHFQDLGHEVGIHIDPLDISQNRGIDGLQAMETELQWMRDNGLNVVSMASHNSPAAYGANNWEVFQGRNEREEVQGLKLGTVDEKALGLECDAYDVLRQLQCLFISVLYEDQFTVNTIPFSKQGSRKENWKTVQKEIADTTKPILVTAHPFYYRHKIKPQIKLVHVLSLTKTGTTLLLMLMASDSDNKAFALGHATKFYRDFHKLEKICMYHRPVCSFWQQFKEKYSHMENPLLDIADYTGATHILGENFQFEMDTDLITDLRDPRIDIQTIFNVRDGRGVCASYWRINPHLPFESVVQWYYHAISNWHPQAGAFVIRYEDVMRDPLPELRRIGEHIGLQYTQESISHWNENHHQISGNVHATGSNVIKHDERWKRELSAENLKTFDKYCGEINASYGYH